MVPLKTRIMLAEDHAVVRRGLRMVLEAEPDMEVVAEVCLLYTSQSPRD